MARKRRAAKRPKGAAKTPTALKRSARAALSVATSGRRPVRRRVAAMAQAPLAVCDSDKDLQATAVKALKQKSGLHAQFVELLPPSSPPVVALELLSAVTDLARGARAGPWTLQA